MKKLSVMSLIVISASSQAYAFPGVNSLKKLTATSLHAPDSTPVTCTNFSGTWKGQCATDGVSGSMETVIIEQSECRSITVNHEEMAIGGVRHESVSMPSGPSTAFDMDFTSAETWGDSTGTSINIQGYVFARQINDGTPVSAALTGQYQVKDSRLFVDVQLQGGINSKVSCAYDKQ